MSKVTAGIAISLDASGPAWPPAWLRLHIAPIVLGRGERLFEGVGEIKSSRSR